MGANIKEGLIEIPYALCGRKFKDDYERYEKEGLLSWCIHNCPIHVEECIYWNANCGEGFDKTPLWKYIDEYKDVIS